MSTRSTSEHKEHSDLCLYYGHYFCQALYAPPGHNHEIAFNSVQRAHQNTLESYSLVMLQMMCAGLKYPVTSAACGAVYVVGRVIYGYGESERRVPHILGPQACSKERT